MRDVSALGSSAPFRIILTDIAVSLCMLALRRAWGSTFDRNNRMKNDSLNY